MQTRSVKNAAAQLESNAVTFHGGLKGCTVTFSREIFYNVEA